MSPGLCSVENNEALCNYPTTDRIRCDDGNASTSAQCWGGVCVGKNVQEFAQPQLVRNFL
eukprot:TRINITY_DN9264_c0_g1_i1.p3 TRINITY_DN9264_c0_g1~~TRINITY_DN9264_c0_g1_i1.p3  ORF type:complete len:60 (-),score=10.09 TRINITY_DN9264_c0_g1_i1:37-216(-)